MQESCVKEASLLGRMPLAPWREPHEPRTQTATPATRRYRRQPGEQTLLEPWWLLVLARFTSELARSKVPGRKKAVTAPCLGFAPLEIRIGSGSELPRVFLSRLSACARSARSSCRSGPGTRTAGASAPLSLAVARQAGGRPRAAHLSTDDLSCYSKIQGLSF